MLRFIFKGIFFLNSTLVWAAPCCGGSSAIPALIAGDDQAQLSVAISQGQVIGDAPVQGSAIFRAPGDLEKIQTVRLDGAYRVWDRFQGSIGLPVVSRSREYFNQEGSAWGIGDLTLGVAYEILPEWSYSVWRPHGFLFFQSTLPTGPSIYDGKDPMLLDARGRGFFTTALGGALFKVIDSWDFILSTEIHRSFAKTVNSLEGESIFLTPGFGGSCLFGLGYNFKIPIRIGISITPVYEDGIHSDGEIKSMSASQLVWNTSFQLSYLVSEEWSSSLIYVDQTLMGPAHNVSLSRMASLNLQKRWTL